MVFWPSASSHFLRLAIQQLANREMKEALAGFNTILSEKPTNLIALLGRVRFR
jgi:hypothetical protein